MALTIERGLVLKEVQKIVPLGRTWIYHQIKRGLFPKPIKLGKLSLWPESEIQAWLEQRKNERGAA